MLNSKTTVMLCVLSNKHTMVKLHIIQCDKKKISMF